MKMKVITGVSIFSLLILFVTTLIVNSNIKGVEESRDKRLDMYELTKQWVIQDIRDYILIQDEEGYKETKGKVHMTRELKDELFGNAFNYSKHGGYTSISFIDSQYTLEKDGKFIVYLLANVTKDNQTKEMNFLVFIHNNSIYDIVAY